MIIPSHSFGVVASSRPKIVVASSPDVTPDAVNWSDLQYEGAGMDPYQRTVKQITGINQTITLQLTYTSTQGSIWYKIAANANNELTYTNTPSGYTLVSSGGTFTVTNNQYVEFLITDGPSYGGLMQLFTITVTNVTDSNTVLDTFTAFGSG